MARIAEQIERSLERDTTPRRLAVNLPGWMLRALQDRAQELDVTVTDLVRRAIALERTLLADPDNEIVIRNRRTQDEKTIAVLN